MVSAIIQARLASTRLPNKTLAVIENQTMLEHLVERINACQAIDEIIVATTTQPEDEAILQMASKLSLHTYRGSVNDVLDRYYQSAKLFHADVIVRVTPDNPFTDPQVLGQAVHHLQADSSLDYVSNKIEPTFPEGLDVEVFTFEALERAWQNSTLPSEREHVTPFIWKHPDQFNIANIRHTRNLSHLRWTVDYDADLEFARAVYHKLYKPGEIFLMEDVIQLLDLEPHLTSLNQGIVRHEGYHKSLSQDKINGQ